MSRYRIPGKRKDVEVFVGWDNPLESYFCQVFHEDLDEEVEDETLFWIGADPPGPKYIDIHSFADAIKDWADLPKEIAVKLQKDYENRTPPTPLQMRNRKLVEEVAWERNEGRNLNIQRGG